MHDEPPPQFSIIVKNNPNKCMGSSNDPSVNWPPRSPGINPLNYFMETSNIHGLPADRDEQLR